MKLNILMVQKEENLTNLNWKPTQMVVEPNKFMCNTLSQETEINLDLMPSIQFSIMSIQVKYFCKTK